MRRRQLRHHAVRRYRGRSELGLLLNSRFLVPWRTDDGERARLWEWCKPRWLPLGIPIIEGTSSPGPFSRAAAINDAACGEWDVAVVLDADVFADVDQVLDAIERAHATGRLTLAYREFVGLTAHMTTRVMAGWPGDPRKGARFRSEIHESSIVVVPRKLWDELGGFDERFVGWGQEDVAFCHAARVIGGGIERIDGPVFHLWHRRSGQRNEILPSYKAAQVLGRRYREITEPEQMRALLAERGQGMRTLDLKRQQTFRKIYETNAWNGKDGTRAGPGSSLVATEAIRSVLVGWMDELGCSSVLDAACGDSLWMPELPGYVGIDIVPEVVGAAKLRYPDRDYRIADICHDDLPEADLILCRDAMQHLSLADGLAALNNFRRTGAKWLVASSYENGVNNDVASGSYFQINLRAAPFWLGEPVRKIPDGTWENGLRYPQKILGAWAL